METIKENESIEKVIKTARLRTNLETTKHNEDFTVKNIKGTPISVVSKTATGKTIGAIGNDIIISERESEEEILQELAEPSLETICNIIVSTAHHLIKMLKDEEIAKEAKAAELKGTDA